MLRCSFGGKLFAVVTAVFLTFGLIGCGDGGKSNPVTSSDGKLALGDNEVWSTCNEDSDCEGYIFKENGDLFIVAYNEDKKTWYGIDLGMKYTEDKDKKTITVIMFGIPGDVINYSFSSNSLILKESNGETLTYTKKSNQKIEILDGGTTVGGGDDNLVVGDNEAWTGCFQEEDDDFEQCEGLIFKKNGDLLNIDYDKENDIWYGSSFNLMSYSAKDNVITLYIVAFGIYIPVDSLSYNISGKTLTVTDSDGETRIYTKTSDLNLILTDELFNSPKTHKAAILSKSLLKTKTSLAFKK
jgi:hypothetical protein